MGIEVFQDTFSVRECTCFMLNVYYSTFFMMIRGLELLVTVNTEAQPLCTLKISLIQVSKFGRGS
jgi:hypothetical protein